MICISFSIVSLQVNPVALNLTTSAQQQQKGYANDKQHAHQPKNVVVGQHRGVAIHRDI
jgi:hypothetical protein